MMDIISHLWKALSMHRQIEVFLHGMTTHRYQSMDGSGIVHTSILG